MVAFSSGNHAQAVALVGKMLNIHTTILMPNNAPTTKLDAAKEYGATVIQYDPNKESRENIAKELESLHGYTLIPPFDHPDIIAGQATAVMEMIEEIGNLDMLLVPCGGGWLLSHTVISKGRVGILFPVPRKSAVNSLMAVLLRMAV